MTAQLIFGEPWDDYTKSRALGSSALHAWGTMGRAQWSADYLESEAYSDDDVPDNGAGAKEGGDYLDSLLTGNKPADKFVIRPETYTDEKGVEKPWNGNANVCKSWNSEQNAAGKTIISAQQDREVRRALPMAREALDVLMNLGGTISYQATLRGEVEGMEIQTRPDIVIDAPDMLVIADLKYVGQIDKFARDWVGSRYEIQTAAGVHLARLAGITKRIEFRFLLVESGTENPRCRCLRIPEAHVEQAIRRLTERCADIRDVRDSALGFTDSVEFDDIDLPGWAKNKLESRWDA